MSQMKSPEAGSAPPRGGSPLLRALRHKDFRLLFIGALLSFVGSQMQNVAQGYWVYEATGSKAQLAMVTFAWALPVMLLAPFAGVVADQYDRRAVLVWCEALLAVSAGALALLYWLHSLQYWHVLVSAVLGGLVQTVEAPTRQSVVRSAVGDQDLPAAIPVMGMSFNIARILGAAAGGLVLQEMGVLPCFILNAVSFGALIFSVLMIKANMKPTPLEGGPTKDLLLEGMHFTLKSRPLRTLFLMESATSVFGMFYISLLPAYVKSQLHLGADGLGYANSAIGIGAIVGLLFLGMMSDRPIKVAATRISMMAVALAIFALGLLKTPGPAYAVMAGAGAASITQFNTTNTLFQIMSPEELRGRVLAMHLWAVNGVSPFGIFVFGWMAEFYSLTAAMCVGGAALLVASIWGWSQTRHVPEPSMPDAQPAGAA